MNHHKPTLLILSSSFPQSRDDETCGYIREFARQMALEFTVRVLTPADAKAHDDGEPGFHLERARSFLPPSLDPLQAGRDFNQLLTGNLISKGFVLLSLLAYFIRAARRARHADVICSHWLLPCGLMGALLGSLLRKPHIAIEHSGALHLLRRVRGGKLLARFIVRRSRRVITVSEDLKNKLIALCPEASARTEVIAMGIGGLARATAESRTNCKPMEPLLARRRARKPRILFMGRLVEIKGVEVLLRAVSTLPEVQLLIAGDGEQRPALERLAEKLNLDAVFLGHLGEAEKAGFFAAGGILVIPSLRLPDGRTEGMPVVALEGMAAGLPLIAADVGGLSEIVIDGQNGLLFESGNSRLLADRIQLLLRDRGLRERLSAGARQTAESFDWRLVSSRFSDIFKDCDSTNGSVERYQTASDSRL
jgi:glycosyltransferase involved in cell wall biosynthesis